MVHTSRMIFIAAITLALTSVSSGYASTSSDDGRFIVANMAPPETSPPPPVDPAAAPEAPIPPATPEAVPPAAPEVPAEAPPATLEEPLPPPDQTTPAPNGMGTTAIFGIVAAIVAAGIAGFWFMRRK